MTSPHQPAPDGSFVVGDGWQWGQSMNVDVVDLLTMGGILPDPGNITGTLRGWLSNLPLPILELMFRPLIPLSTDGDWVDTPTAVDTILNAMPLKQLEQFLDWVKNVFDPFHDMVMTIIDLLSGKVVTGLAPALQAVADFLAGLFKIADWQAWLAGLPALIVKLIKDLTGLDFSSIGAFVASLIAAIKNITGLDLSSVQALFNSLKTLIDNAISVSVKVVSDAVKLVTDTVQALLDGVWKVFTGGTGSGKTVAEAVAAVQNWLANVFQKLVDGIVGLIPGLGSGTNPIQDAITVIGGILGIGQGAQNTANNAAMAVAALEAAQAGGGFDQFDYPNAASLPSPWVATYSGNAATTWGPNGSGVVKAKISGITGTWREVHYRHTTATMTKANVKVSVVLDKPPGTESPSYFWIEAQRSSTDQSGIRVKVGRSDCQFESVNASGIITNIGSKVAIMNAAAGDTYTLDIVGTTATLLRNGNTQHSVTITPLSGRDVGFGAMYSAYVNLFGHPAPEFDGVAWA